MTTFTSEDRENANKLVEEAPYNPGYEDAVVYPTVIVDSGASIKSLGAYIELEERLETYREQIRLMQAEIQRLKRRLIELGVDE